MRIECGLGRRTAHSVLVLSLVESTRAKIVLDANGINVIALHIHEIKHVDKPMRVTSHVREFGWLFGRDVSQSVETLVSFVMDYHCYITAKSIARVLLSKLANLIKIQWASWGGLWVAAAVFWQAGNQPTNCLSEYGMTPNEMLCDISHVFNRHNTKEW